MLSTPGFRPVVDLYQVLDIRPRPRRPERVSTSSRRWYSADQIRSFHEYLERTVPEFLNGLGNFYVIMD